MFSLKDIADTFRRELDWASRCLWCGQAPRLRVRQSFNDACVRFVYICHFRSKVITIDEETLFHSPGPSLRAAYCTDPFPLPRRPMRLPAVAARPFIIGPDGCKAWLMPERTP